VAGYTAVAEENERLRTANVALEKKVKSLERKVAKEFKAGYAASEKRYRDVMHLIEELAIAFDMYKEEWD